MSDLENDPPERAFLQARTTLKSGDELLGAVATLPELNPDGISTEPDRDTPVYYEMIVKKGETFNHHPENDDNPVLVNQQVSDQDMAKLRETCNARQLVEAVRHLPEFNFSIDDVLKFVKGKKKSSPCFGCGVTGCFRQQERWQGRVLHGCYPNTPLVEFQHDKSDEVPSCYFVPKRERTTLSDKYLDALPDFEDIEHHRAGKEHAPNLRRKRKI